ncbi:hypothetical protein ACLOJK_024199 [Asimina triloba]
MASREPKSHPSHCTIRPRTGQQRATVLGNGRRTKAPSNSSRSGDHGKSQIQQIWAAAHSFNGMHQRFRRWPRPAAGGISMPPLEIGPSAAS